MSTSTSENEVSNERTEADEKPITQSNAAIGVSTEGKSGGDDGSYESVRVEDVQRIFTLIPKLPPELRVKAWRYALPGPRRIAVLMQWIAIEEDWLYHVICKDKESPSLILRLSRVPHRSTVQIYATP
jgi:hypothetical protein